MPFFQGLRLVMSHGPYVKLIAGFLFTSLAFMVSGARDVHPKIRLIGVGLEKIWIVVKPWGRRDGVGASRGLWDPQFTFFFISLTCPMPQLVEGNFALFCTYTLGFRNEFQNLLLAIMVSTEHKVS